MTFERICNAHKDTDRHHGHSVMPVRVEMDRTLLVTGFTPFTRRR